MVKPILTFCLLLTTLTLLASEKEKSIGIFYYSNIYGIVHLLPSINSESLTTISCGQPLRAYSKLENKWIKVKAGPYKGHVQTKYISKKKPKCFQDTYSKFVESFELDLSDMYYWGRLYDQYVQGKSRVK